MIEQGETPRTIRVNGADLHYIEAGEGAPLILVHGSLSDYRTWRPQMEPFSRRHHVVNYSRRYHYPNAFSGHDLSYSAALHAQDLATLIEALDLGPSYIVGASYGAYTALLFAHERPDLARALVLGEPPILPWLQEIPGGVPLYDEFMGGTWEPAQQAFKRRNLEEGVKLFLEGVLGKPGLFERLPPDVREAQMQNAPEMELETSSPVYFPLFSCEDAASVQVPILLLNGEVSPRMFHLITDRLEACLSRTERATIAGASHPMNSDNPDDYNETVLGFLAGQAATRNPQS